MMYRPEEKFKRTSAHSVQTRQTEGMVLLLLCGHLLYVCEQNAIKSSCISCRRNRVDTVVEDQGWKRHLAKWEPVDLISQDSVSQPQLNQTEPDGNGSKNS